ncbi:MAG: hypothetical protein ACYC35_20205 [Pirellulales bacterium]
MFEFTKNRMAATSVAACLFIYAGCQVGLGEYLVRTATYVGFCLGLIWFGPVLWPDTGWARGRPFGEATPEILVIGMGWLLLLLTPLVISAAKAQMLMGW